VTVVWGAPDMRGGGGGFTAKSLASHLKGNAWAQNSYFVSSTARDTGGSASHHWHLSGPLFSGSDSVL